MSPDATPEYFDVLTEDGALTGRKKLRSDVHRDGDWHRAVHVWVWAPESCEVLIQRRAAHKESWPNLWDISAAGHVEAGDGALETAQRELKEEVGLQVPPEGFEHVLQTTHRSVLNDGAFKNNEHIDIYFVSEVRWIHARDLLEAWDRGDPTFVGNSGDTEYRQLFVDFVQREERK